MLLPPSVCLCVCPLCYLLLNHWTKFNQIWCASYSHEWSVQCHFFAPPLGAHGKDQKVKYHLILITKSISKFLYQTLCVFSQMKDTKHISRDFHTVDWVMPQGWDFGAVRVSRGSILFFKHGHVAYQIDRDDEPNRMQV